MFPLDAVFPCDDAVTHNSFQVPVRNMLFDLEMLLGHLQMVI
jgi:hypothetical protein